MAINKTGISKRNIDGTTKPPYVKMATGGGAGVTITWLILRNIDFKAWDVIGRKAADALLVQNGPLPVILFLFVVGIFAMYHRAMASVIEAKDGEISRLVVHRDRLEAQSGIVHPTSQSEVAKK